MPEKIYDCAVIGAGCFGAWTALRLRESGRTVALVDAFGAGNSLSSSGGASRIIRAGYGADEIYSRWAMRSLDAWQELFARIGSPELFHRTGVLWTAHPGHPHAEGTRAVFERLAIPHEFLDRTGILRHHPALHFDHDVVGIFEPSAGALLASQAVQAVTEEARRFGVDFFTQRIAFPVENPAAHEYVFACGPWLPKLFPDVVGGRIQVTRQAIFYLDAWPAGLPCWIDFSEAHGGYSIPPVAGKSFKLGLDLHGPEFDPDTGSREPTAGEIARIREFLAGRFPALAGVPILETEICQYESTSTGDFLLDRHPSIPNIWLAGGGSGHGFKHGPAVGEYLVRMLDGGEPEPRFSWQRKSLHFARTIY